MGEKRYSKTHDELKDLDNIFMEACEMAHVERTKRQYSKYLLHRGMAFKFKAQATEKLQPKTEAPK
jgi:hypothetical protein